MKLDELVRLKREQILEAAKEHGACRIRVFGSVARRQDDDSSDIDFLVDMEPGRSLLDLGGLQVNLEQLLNTKVDVVTERGLNDRIRSRVISEALPL